jgi:single-stranded-DNA-specific exonuclease
LYDNPNEDILTRLLKIRNITDSIEDFLNPTFKKYRKDPFLLSDMDKAVARILKAIKDGERIMILGDYDVDGITSSALVYEFFTKILNYKNISVRLPNRLKDGYGIKKHHLDEIKSKDVSLVITVDNGITAIEEAKYAREL